MDPNETLERIRRIVNQYRTSRMYGGDGLSHDDYEVLADLVGDLDEWLSRGGAHPTAWSWKGLI